MFESSEELARYAYEAIKDEKIEATRYAGTSKEYILEIKRLYDEFLLSFKYLVDNFHLKNPYEITLLYEFLLYHGYLSVNHDYFYDFNLSPDPYIKDGMFILGANLIKGTGVCRNLSSMLKSILNTCGFEAYMLPCYVKDKSILSYLIGNHCICLSATSSHIYFLDPTEECIYFRDSDDHILLYREGYEPVYIRSHDIVINGGQVKRINEILRSKRFILSEEQIKDIKLHLEKICGENIPLFDKYYQSNLPLYEEIVSKLSRLKVK